MSKVHYHRSKIILAGIFGFFLLITLGLVSNTEVNAKNDASSSRRSTLPPLKNSFVLREGTASDITCLALGRRNEVYAAGISDKNSVIYKLDAKLKTIQEMVKFGSPKGQESITDMAVDSRGNIFVTGYTNNRDFPVTRGSYDIELVTKGAISSDEVIIVKFSSNLKLLAATFVGGDADERAHAIAIDERDNIYVAGYAEGGHPKYDKRFIPPPGAYDPEPPPDGQAKAFVAKLNNDLTRLLAATLIGGKKEEYDSDDEAYDLAIDRDGNVWIAGQSNSDDFPVTRFALEPFYSGRGDIFVSKLDPDLTRLLASTYLGGMNQEMAVAMKFGPEGDVFVGGWTESPDFPMVEGGYDTKYSHEEEDAFIVKLSGDLQKLRAATYLGGDYDASGYGDDLLSAMALSADGKTVWATGRTESENFPVTSDCYKSYTNDSDNPHGAQYHRNDKKPREASSDDPDWGDGFITQFDSNLAQCRYSTFFGGDNLEYMDDILIDGTELLLAGTTWSHAFPRITTKEKEPWSRGFVIRFNWRKGR